MVAKTLAATTTTTQAAVEKKRTTKKNPKVKHVKIVFSPSHVCRCYSKAHTHTHNCAKMVKEKNKTNKHKTVSVNRGNEQMYQDHCRIANVYTENDIRLLRLAIICIVYRQVVK